MGCRKRGFRKTVYDGEVISLATNKIAKKLFVKPFNFFFKKRTLKIYIDYSNASFDIIFLLMSTSLLGPLSYSFPGTQICTRTGNEVEKIEITSWAGGAYGIFAQVGDVSEIERASEISDTNNECENSVQARSP